jgi:hypothetical protein
MSFNQWMQHLKEGKKEKNMTKTIELFLSVIFLGVLVTSSCKKYPDGPLLSLWTKEHRIVGTWDVEYFSINGHDSTEYLKSKPFYGMYSFDNRNNSNYCYYNSSNENYHLYGWWQLENDKKNITIDFNIDSVYTEQMGPYRAKSSSWEIRRLAEKEMWLKTNYSDGKEYYIKFKLIKNF